MRIVITALLILLLTAPACGKPKLEPGSGYGYDPINIKQREPEMLLPKSIPVTSHAELDIHITDAAIFVGGEAVVMVKDGRVPSLSKRDGPDGFFIDPLFKRLKRESRKLKEAEKQGGRAFRGEVMLVARRGTPFRLLAEVLYTTNQAEFTTYQFFIEQLRQ